MSATSVGSDRQARMLGALLTGRPVDPALDWESLVQRATDERLAPLLFWKLRHDQRLPEPSKSQLRAELYRAEASNLSLYRALASVLERGASAGLEPPVLLKGGALATSVYEELGLRPMSDIDMLVPKEALPDWLAITRALSFRRLSPEMAPGLTEAVQYQIALEGGPTGDAFIEIHFGLIGGASDWRAPDLKWFLARTEPWTPDPSLAVPEARQLQPTAHVLYLAAHALLQHGGARARLVWLYDIHVLVTGSAERIDWNELSAKASELQWDAALGAALSRARELFDTRVPEDFAERLVLGAAERSRHHVERRALPSQSRAEVVFSDLTAVRGRDRLRWGFAILFPRPEYMRWRYPWAGRFWPLCYPYRCALVLWEGARALVRG